MNHVIPEFLAATRPKPTLTGLPQEVLEIIAEFCGNVSTIAPFEDVNQFTDAIVHPIMNAAASNQWQSGYNDLCSLALTSKRFTYAAHRALLKVVQVNSTVSLMRFVRTLLQFPEKRGLVRCFIANIGDHAHPLLRPLTIYRPQPFVLSEFLNHFYPSLLSTKLDEFPVDNFFRQIVPFLKDLFEQMTSYDRVSPSVIDSAEVYLHTLEDQILTAMIQLLPKLEATRICFGPPHRHNVLRLPARQPDVNTQNHMTYASLRTYQCSTFKSLTLDLSALLLILNLSDFIQGYPSGLPPSIERLTLIGCDETDLHPPRRFNLHEFETWLHNNVVLKELRMLAGFDEQLCYSLPGDGQPSANWNHILRHYRCTLEVLKMEPYIPPRSDTFARYGAPRKLDCLSDMEALREFKVPIHALDGLTYGLPDTADKEDDTHLMKTLTGLPPRWTKMEIVAMNPPSEWDITKVDQNMWKVFEWRRGIEETEKL